MKLSNNSEYPTYEYSTYTVSVDDLNRWKVALNFNALSYLRRMMYLSFCSERILWEDYFNQETWD
jgi:hypothetical protein